MDNTDGDDRRNSTLDFFLGMLGLFGLIICLIRKTDGNEISFEAFGAGFAIVALVAIMATCIAVGGI